MTMNNEPKLALFTWAHILGSILIPFFVFLNSTMSSSVPGSELFQALFALTIMTVIGITLGYCVRPDTNSAELAVYGSPFVSVLVGLIVYGGDVLAYQTSLLSALRSLAMLALVLIFFSMPTAGVVRATLWFRER
jgi:hypothetical protein